MLDKLLDFSIKHRFLVLLATLAVAGLGVWNFNRLPIDAVPDITNVQVQINTAGHEPTDMPTSSATSLIVIGRFCITIFFTASTF